MTMNPFPPQAYTRDTLVKAYQWLQNQSPQVKELATTPDLLISLYVKAKTQGEDFLERPSLKTFKSELKSLAGMMGEFETQEKVPERIQDRTSDRASEKPHEKGHERNSERSQDIHAHSPMPKSAPSMSPGTAPQGPGASPLGNPIGSTQLPSAMPAPPFQLDARSLLILQEVKQSLNLSSESEALRLLISMGHNRLKSL